MVDFCGKCVGKYTGMCMGTVANSSFIRPLFFSTTLVQQYCAVWMLTIARDYLILSNIPSLKLTASLHLKIVGFDVFPYDFIVPLKRGHSFVSGSLNSSMDFSQVFESLRFGSFFPGFQGGRFQRMVKRNRESFEKKKKKNDIQDWSLYQKNCTYQTMDMIYWFIYIFIYISMYTWLLTFVPGGSKNIGILPVGLKKL